MARQSRPTPDAVDDGVSTEVLTSKGTALTAAAQISSAVSASFGDDQPYERERLIGQARLFMAHSAQAYFELGKCLIQIKENEPHGEWTRILEERLRIDVRTARKAMQVVLKLTAALPNRPAPAVLELGWTKVVELIAEPEEDLAALEDGGTVAGHTLEDIEAMSTRELRKALLEERKRTAAKDKIIAKKDAKLNELAEADERRRVGTPDEREATQLAELRDAGISAELSLQQLVAAVDQAMQQPATEAAELQARQTLEFIVQRLADLCAERAIAVDVLGERVEPGWHRDMADEAEAAPARKRKG